MWTLREPTPLITTSKCAYFRVGENRKLAAVNTNFLRLRLHNNALWVGLLRRCLAGLKVSKSFNLKLWESTKLQLKVHHRSSERSLNTSSTAKNSFSVEEHFPNHVKSNFASRIFLLCADSNLVMKANKMHYDSIFYKLMHRCDLATLPFIVSNAMVWFRNRQNVQRSRFMHSTHIFLMFDCKLAFGSADSFLTLLWLSILSR